VLLIIVFYLKVRWILSPIFAAMYFIDSHTHLFSNQFNDDRHAMVERAIAEKVEHMIMPNVDLESIEGMYALEAKFPENCYATMGLHPCSVKADFEEVLLKMEAELEQRTFAAIGETGLDYYWDLTFKAEQKQSLIAHIKWAKRYKIPIILHTRESLEDALTLIEAHNDDDLRGVFHCFGGTKDDIDRIGALGGFYVGIGGVLTFKKSNLPELLVDTPWEMIVLETDSPYLAPTPYRGKRNESAYIPFIAKKMAEIKKCSIEDVAKITSKNAEKLFYSAFMLKHGAKVIKS